MAMVYGCICMHGAAAAPATAGQYSRHPGHEKQGNEQDGSVQWLDTATAAPSQVTTWCMCLSVHTPCYRFSKSLPPTYLLPSSRHPRS